MKMNDKEFLEKESRRNKEFIYHELRKRLCYHVVNGDISNNDCLPLETLTTEQVRTVFNIGYKLAMNQTLDSLRKLKRDENSSTIPLNLAIQQIEDRLITCDCHTTYEDSYDSTMFEQSIERAKHFQFELTREDITSLMNKS
jgi:hypothetical protein